MNGSVRKRGENRWQITIDLGRGPDGKRKQKWVTVEGTKRQAEAEKNRLLHELNTGSFVEPHKMTVGQYLRHWLEHYARTNVGPKTYDNYEDFIEGNLIPALGHHPLTGLQPLHIQAYYTHALRHGRKDGKGGLSPQTVLHHHRVLSLALKQAVKWQLLIRNPAEAVEPPRVRRKEMNALDVEGAARLLEAADGTRLYFPILLAISTGMRRGEVLGLRWEDVDLDAGIIQIRQVVVQTKAGLVFKDPKTEEGKRAVSIGRLADNPPSPLATALLRHKGRQAELRLALGEAYHNHGLVVALEDGRPFPPNAFTIAYLTLMKKVGFPGLRFQDLRHSHVSQLLKGGESLLVVSKRVGHADPALTLRVYGHLLPGMDQSAALKMNSTLHDAMEERRRQRER